MGKERGFSLIELLIVIAIVSITAVFAIPSFQHLVRQSKEHILSSQLLRAISMARNEALLRGMPVTLCKSRDHATCSGNWQDGQLLFLDEKQDGVVIDKEHILSVFDTSAAGVLHWRSSLQRDDLAILPSGSTRAENGTFWYCAEHANNPAWAIVVNKAGRAYFIDAEEVGKLKSLSCVETR